MVDVITVIVSALAAGATAGLKDTAKKVVTDGYNAFKSILIKKYPSVKVSLLEEDPKATEYQNVVKKNLTDSKADKDLDLLEATEKLVELLERHSSLTLQTFGVDLKKVKAAKEIVIKNYDSEHGIKAEEVEAERIEIINERAPKA
jgi:hypothetical protein